MFLFFYNRRFNEVDNSLSIIFNFGACTTFYNVLYKTSYACNMSVSFTVLMDLTKVIFVLYAYSVNMYCIPLLMVTGKISVKSVHTFLVSGSMVPWLASTATEDHCYMPVAWHI